MLMYIRVLLQNFTKFQPTINYIFLRFHWELYLVPIPIFVPALARFYPRKADTKTSMDCWPLTGLRGPSQVLAHVRETQLCLSGQVNFERLLVIPCKMKYSKPLIWTNTLLLRKLRPQRGLKRRETEVPTFVCLFTPELRCTESYHLIGLCVFPEFFLDSPIIICIT